MTSSTPRYTSSSVLRSAKELFNQLPKMAVMPLGVAALAFFSSQASASTAFTATWPPAPVTSISACVAGSGHDYQVGPNSGQLASLDLVPWESLAPGDTVRIFYKDTPYRGKILVAAAGTLSAPIRICGVKSADGKRPVIDGQDAVARKGLKYTAASLSNIQETRSVIMIDRLGTDGWTASPSYIQIDGLEVRGAKPANSFTNSFGTVQNYSSFGACIWVNRGHHIILADNEIHDCSQGIFTNSTDDSYPATGDAAFSVTTDVQIIGNDIYDNGIVGDVHMHNAYVQSIGVVYEFNRFGAPKVGALGNGIKDRSVGSIIRYNRIEQGAHAIDMVEAEAHINSAEADPRYRVTYVYGNQILKTGSTGSVIHYGGDHYGATPTSNWGEAHFRKGTLYFYNNTLYLNGTGVSIFQLSTTDEHAEVWNNVFAAASSITYTGLRATTSGISSNWTAGGVMNFGVNWINSNWGPNNDQWHTVPGTYTGTSNFITGSTLPITTSSTFENSSLVPLDGSKILDATQAQLSAVASYPVTYELDPTTLKPVALSGTPADLGAIQKSVSTTIQVSPPSSPKITNIKQL